MGRCVISPPKRNSLTLRSPQLGQGSRIMAIAFSFASMTDRGRTFFAHQTAFFKARQAEWCKQIGRLLRGNQFSHALAADRPRLEAIGSPANIDDKAIHRGEAHD